MDKQLNLIEIVRTLLKWKWPIIAVTLFSGVLAVLATLFIMDEYYQSFALIYPTNQSMGDRGALFSDKGISDVDAYYYGSKHDANRILTIANASWLVQGMINKYNLSEHYGFTDGTKYLSTRTTEKFMNQYQVYKTDKEAIRINYIDTDSKLAADLVNDVVSNIEQQITKPIDKNKQALVETFGKYKLQKSMKIDSIQNLLKSLSNGTETYRQTNLLYENLQSEYKELSGLYDQYKLAASQKIPGVEIIEPAYIAERKHKPIRSRICLATVFVSFVFACLGAIFIEQAKWIKEQL